MKRRSPPAAPLNRARHLRPSRYLIPAPSLETARCKTSDAREYAYNRKSPFGRLDQALDEANAKSRTVVSMKQDWKKIFAFE